ncbi:2-oxoadipate dioxygenase/decarboxylase HglS [Pseudodonghicola xiamenensis]|uniref:2-oxoadipate dioxygenase/decarboxylase n=1 Tax=Pseudodonghicola xiamenensis TaxID=337702 RepID=A0A8J3HAM3_9RHOB|nr:VOC family protein [Pseudodonghicola xiamenensis]GHH00960.1 DUF1338 domain-containing protein [Pseudodonghicola xiamenensis]
MTSPQLSPNDIRTLFSRAMSEMYRDEVPAYGTLLDLVAELNGKTLAGHPEEKARLASLGELERLSEERHGAIRLGTAAELATMRQLFAVMGMYPVGYYDLSVAGVPVHSTAFRPLEDAALRANPFRVFTSLLRLDLIADETLRADAEAVLAQRQIFTPGCLRLIEKAETEGGLSAEDARSFVAEALETFRWHTRANVDHRMYRRLHDAHRLIADVVAFKGPHINHLTPRTLDIDAVQRMMPEKGVAPKAVIEGPPARRVPILLRQTSFKALEEPVDFITDGTNEPGSHTARFGEIEQRGMALTPKGQALYDRLLGETRAAITPAPDGSNAAAYMAKLQEIFAAFPDDPEQLRKDGLGYFRYSVTGKPASAADVTRDADALIAAGLLRADPIVYEDFLPVSAAGIFQSNLGDDAAQTFGATPNRDMFETALGARVIDLHHCYAEIEAASLARARSELGRSAAA